MSHKRYEDPVLDDSAEIAEDTKVEEIEEAAEEIVGVVTDCLKLNIRKEPSKDSEVAAIVTCLDELRIDPDASTDDWYAVCTAAGIEGFCMKKFVAVRQ